MLISIPIPDHVDMTQFNIGQMLQVQVVFRETGLRRLIVQTDPDKHWGGPKFSYQELDQYLVDDNTKHMERTLNKRRTK